jgi:hypothetical protein
MDSQLRVLAPAAVVSRPILYKNSNRIGISNDIGQSILYNQKSAHGSPDWWSIQFSWWYYYLCIDIIIDYIFLIVQNQIRSFTSIHTVLVKIPLNLHPPGVGYRPSSFFYRHTDAACRKRGRGKSLIKPFSRRSILRHSIDRFFFYFSALCNRERKKYMSIYKKMF